MLRRLCLALCLIVCCLGLASSAFALNHGTYLYHNGVYTSYSTAQLAFNAAVPGDSVVLGPGLYHLEGSVKTTGKSGTASQPITIRGDGTPKPIISMEGVKKSSLPMSHAPIVVNSNYIVVENLEIKNTSQTYGHFQNSSGIYTYAANYTTVRDVYIHDCGHGIYASDNCANLTIENSEWCYNGYATDQMYHNAYINGGPNLVQYNTWHHCKAGLGYKDRSTYLQFLHNTVFRNGNYELDMMKGTGVQNALVMGNVILKPGAGTNNDYQIIAFTDRGGGTMTFTNNYVRAGSANNTFIHVGTAESCVANNNTFDNNGVAAVDIFYGNEGLSLTGTNNWGATDSINRGSTVNWVLGTAPGVIDNINGNFHLTSGSQCINAGSSSVSPLPDKEPVYPTSYVTRSISGNIDIGPYEYSASTGVAPLPSYGLTATALSATSVRLNWTNDSNLATGYRIERLSNDAVGFITAGTAGAGATTWTDTGCVTKTKYVYRVIAYSASGDGGHTNEVVITTP